MSYIINNSDAFVNVKLTEIGREKLAKGALNFSYWAIGDSEINYSREDKLNDDPTIIGNSQILRPKDKQPNIKNWIHNNPTGETVNPLNEMQPSNIKTLKIVANNEAEERGFFSGDTDNGWVTRTDSKYVKDNGTVGNEYFLGGQTIDLGGNISGTTIGNLILFKIPSEEISPSLGLNTNKEPVPHLWYKIQAINGTTIVVDRNLPNLTTYVNNVGIQYYIYGGGEVHDEFGLDTTSYWDSGTLSFNSSCDISCKDVPVWNMNNVWCEDPAGIINPTGGTQSYETHEHFGSYNYLGQKNPFLEYDCEGGDISEELKCEGLSELDYTNKSIAIIHYTNNTISNFYGEFFYVDNDNDKTVKLHIPDIMYHRRYSPNSGATEMGMSFIASGDVKTIGKSDLEYVELIESPDMIFTGDTPEVVGKVFTQLKTIVFDDEEIVAAMSYKSGRNWTLPPLETNLENPTGGTTTGVLLQNETMYVSYGFTNPTGGTLPSSLGCQKYSKITNQTPTSKDVSFKMWDMGLLKYMRKIEKLNYDGRGFYAHNFKVFYQIVSDGSDRPDPSNWKVYDYTTPTITGGIGQTIDPQLIEGQNPVSTGFIIDKLKDSASTQYDITTMLNMPILLEPERLQFGDEKFFYGNIEAYIGATIFKTIFDIRINSGEFTETTNLTRSKDESTNPPDIMVSEVGIYDDNYELVIIGKLSKPITLDAGNTIMIELSMDF